MGFTKNALLLPDTSVPFCHSTHGCAFSEWSDDKLDPVNWTWATTLFWHFLKKNLYMSHCQMLGKFEYGLPAKF